jgi:hypothetical protein
MGRLSPNGWTVIVEPPIGHIGHMLVVAPMLRKAFAVSFGRMLKEHFDGEMSPLQLTGIPVIYFHLNISLDIYM